MTKESFITYEGVHFSEEEMLERSRTFFNFMNKRRSVRDFSDRPVDLEIIENAIRTANTAPSGAHKQPWTYCIISDPEVKKEIREKAEVEELESYNNRMSEEWLEAIAHLGTDHKKPFLEIAPYLVIIFKKVYDKDSDGEKQTNYYVSESVGISAGMFISAIHESGLAALTHTPSPMNFLSQILKRPANERPFLLIPVGHPAENAQIPDLKRKDLDEIAVYYTR
jgi:nitroreductase